MRDKTYADQFCDWLIEENYTHCFFVAGGNIMHILNSARTRFTCIPVVHEVSAAIATEYFNETNPDSKAFALVTAGPGITNSITGISGAWLESRELLVIGGQVKSEDLKGNSDIRQRGIQEIDGVKLVESITKDCLRITRPVNKSLVINLLKFGAAPRMGPVFIEFCLNAQADRPLENESDDRPIQKQLPKLSRIQKKKLRKLLAHSERPLLLIGGGATRKSVANSLASIESCQIPLLTTWNGADRIGSENELYFGRPNTWGQRSANVIIQQSDLVIAVGTRLGLQQTGFNRKQFAPHAKLVQIDIDNNELQKNKDICDLSLQVDARNFLEEFHSFWPDEKNILPWLNFAKDVKTCLPNNEKINSDKSGYINPYDFVEALSNESTTDDVIIPCSSGGAFTTMMQAFNQKQGQIIVTNKGLASMGYGLAGAIGAAYANPGKRVILVEGDGGFAQNLQDLGTAAISKLPIKIFIFENRGYASIRMTQENYFDGAYIGCDSESGLGFPDWAPLFSAFRIPCTSIESSEIFTPKIQNEFSDDKIRAFLVKIDPEQTYFPKISSKVLPDGSMESNPLHKMTPELPPEVSSKVFTYLKVN